MWKYLIFVTIVVYVQGNDNSRLVNIAQGPVRGYLLPNGGAYVFYNIPYATAPRGRDRFKAPLPPPVWMSTFDAVNRGIRCPQSSITMSTQEDCLVANVFVPDTDETNLPVMVNIHGGAYQYGFGTNEEFTDLTRTRKLIVVSFNYRLGVHGFLCLRNEAAPGNAGLKDQVALLRWVQTNIGKFGGNPDDVTLAACSAGSDSVDILTLSSITEGLFKRVIMESGVSTGAVGLQIDPIENAMNFAKVLNFNGGDDLEKVTEFYLSATYQQLTSRLEVIVNNEDVAVLFAPCVEKDIGQERVIADAPINVIKQRNYTKVPMLYGFTNMEGSMRLQFFDTWKDRMNEKFSDFLPAELYFKSEDVKEEVAQKVKEFYFGDDPVKEKNILSYIMYFTDILFGYPMLRSASTRVEALGDTIYLYEYSFVDDNTPNFPHTDVRGAGHCFLSRAVGDQNLSQATPEYKQMVEILRDYWMNFIFTGTPTPSSGSLSIWSPINANRTPHMSIGPVIEVKNNILEHRAAFWDAIYEEYYRGPIVPSADSGGLSTVISNVLLAISLISLYFN